VEIVDRLGSLVSLRSHQYALMLQKVPAAPPMRLPRDELKDRDEQPIVPRSDCPAPFGQLEPDAPLHAQQVV